MKRADLASAPTIPIIGLMRARLLGATKILAALSFAVVAVGMFSQQVFAQKPCDCWIDAKTGLPVPTFPRGAVGEVIRSAPESQYHDSQTGQNYVLTSDGTWIDAKTGQCVPTFPRGAVGEVIRSAPESQYHDSQTGQNYVQVPCPPPEESATAAPPGGTQPQTGSTDAGPATPVQQEPQPSGGVSVPSFGFGGFGHGSDHGGSKGDKR